MYHKLIIVGNLGAEPSMRYTPSGTPVTNFSVATNRKWTNADGTPGEQVVWFRVAAWGRMAEVCNQYLAKGRQVLVEGTLTPDPETGAPRVWTRGDGTAGASFEVRAETVKFLGKGNGNGQAVSDASDAPAEDDDEDMPF